MKKFFFIIVLPIFLSCSAHQAVQYDVTVAGCILFADGLGRNAIAALDMMHDELKMNFSLTRPLYNLQDVPEGVKQILEKNNSNPSNVAILHDALSFPWDTPYKKVPNSKIKIAYSMIEQSQIPKNWAPIINNHFDSVVVPDEFLVEIYKNAGVKKPIFVLPHPVYIDEFLKRPLKTRPNDPFTFGITAAQSPHKNIELLVDAFIKEFQNSSKVKLKIKSLGKGKISQRIQRKIKKLKITNIEMELRPLSWAGYINAMSSLDCYVLVSRGEGFSVTPREAMALGIPCIISNNSAHSTICKSGYVYAVKADIKQPHTHLGEPCGYNWNCRIEDVQMALRTVYERYDEYLKQAHNGREWVKQYRIPYLKAKYLNLFKPKKVILGDQNSVTDEFLMTNDESLYKKYSTLSDR